MRPDSTCSGMRPGPPHGDPWLARIDLLVSVRTDRLDWRHDVRLESVLPEVTVVESLIDGKRLS